MIGGGHITAALSAGGLFRRHVGISRALAMELLAVAFLSISLGSVVLGFFNWQATRGQQMAEAVNRLNSYHAVLTWMIQRFDKDGMDKIGQLIADDGAVLAFRVTNRFGKVLMQAGDLEAEIPDHDFIERKVPDLVDPAFTEARATYVLQRPAIFDMGMIRLQEVTIIGLLFALLIAAETYRRLSRSIVRPLAALHQAVRDHRTGDAWAAPGITRPVEIAELEQEIGEAFDQGRRANARIRQNIHAMTRVLGNFGRAIRYFDRQGNAIDFGTITGTLIEPAIPVTAAGGRAALMADMRRRNQLSDTKSTETDLGEGGPRDILLQFDHEMRGDIHFSVTLVGLDAGEFAVVMTDVTRTRRLEAQASRQQKFEAIGQLAGGIAHDFNNIICVIQMSVDMLEAQHGIGPEHLSPIFMACTRGARLTQGLLSFGRVSKLEVQPLNLNDMAANLLSWSRSILPANIQVETRFDPDAWMVVVDPAMAENALLNLILNARDAMPGGGRLTIETGNLHVTGARDVSDFDRLEAGRYVVLSVADTGHGIDRATLERIFDPFFTTKGPGKGSGVGLSMVMGFARQSGGTVRVLSEPGKGATFRMLFPATVRKPAPTLPDDRDLQEPARPCRILLVEDEAALRSLIAAHLERSGHEVRAVSDAAAAQAAFEADPCLDLLITDIIMPGPRNGVQLAAALRKRVPHLGVILLSGHSRERMAHGVRIGADDILLTKPIRRWDLIRSVNAALRQIHQGVS